MSGDHGGQGMGPPQPIIIWEALHNVIHLQNISNQVKHHPGERKHLTANFLIVE